MDLKTFSPSSCWLYHGRTAVWGQVVSGCHPHWSVFLDESAPRLVSGVSVVVRLNSLDRSAVRRATVKSVELLEDGTRCELDIHSAKVHQPEDHILQFDGASVDPAFALRLPANMVFARRILPFTEIEGVIQVASEGGRTNPGVPVVERILRQPAQFWPVDPKVIEHRARAILGEPGRGGATPAEGIGISDSILLAAYLRQASDVHVDPGEHHLTVRFRVDGMLEVHSSLPMASASEVINRIKVMGGLDIAEKRAPQDGRFTFQRPGGSQTVEIRVATIPTKHGERVTMRLLAVQTASLTLDRLGFTVSHRRILERFLRRNQGLMLMTGPTGSGKTTTLYAALRMLIMERRLNIMTIEDPIEYSIEGISQTEVDQVEKVSFASALRSILRHDPDVVMVGEIRDAETAGIAMKAAMTGHMVLGTLHTNSAASAVTRLKDMGVDAYLVAATLRLAVAQRLSRRLCPECRILRQMTDEESRILGLDEACGFDIYEPGGCVYCAGSGYKGRVGLYELLELRADWAREVAAGADEARLVEHMRGSGLKLLNEDAMDKLRDGLIHISDAVQIASSW